MEYLDNRLTYQTYTLLRSSVGWNNLSEEQVAKSLDNSIYTVTVVENNEPVAMGRLVGDGIYFLIVDVIVKPEFQRRGIGGKIIDALLAYVENATPVGGRSSVQLIAEKGKEGFYLKKGFKLLPHDFCGPGMRKVIKK